MDDDERYGTPIAETPDPHTGLTPIEEQVDRNRRLAAALHQLHAKANR